MRNSATLLYAVFTLALSLVDVSTPRAQIILSCIVIFIAGFGASGVLLKSTKMPHALTGIAILLFVGSTLLSATTLIDLSLNSGKMRSTLDGPLPEGARLAASSGPAPVTGGFMNRADDFKADRDFLVVSDVVDNCAANVRDYFATGATPALKDACSNRINTQLFTLWLLYFGPWRFDISGDDLVNRYIINVKAKYRDIANKGSLRDDPLNISARISQMTFQVSAGQI
jgi:hypothetical protein